MKRYFVTFENHSPVFIEAYDFENAVKIVRQNYFEFKMDGIWCSGKVKK